MPESSEDQGWTWVDDDGVEHWIPDCAEHDDDEHDDAELAGGDS